MPDVKSSGDAFITTQCKMSFPTVKSSLYSSELGVKLLNFLSYTGEH